MHENQLHFSLDTILGDLGFGNRVMPPVVDEWVEIIHAVIHCAQVIERRKISYWLITEKLSALGYAVQRGDYVE
jgi:hypothetical protein